MSDLDISIIQQIVDSNNGVSFSDDNIAIVVTEGDEVDWDNDMMSLDIDSLTNGEWSLAEPDDGDYGSIVLEPGENMVTDDFGLGDKSIHRFKKKF